MYNSKITGLGFYVPDNVVTNDDLAKAVADASASAFGEAYRIADKQARYARLDAIRAETSDKLVSEDGPSAEEVRG